MVWTCLNFVFLAPSSFWSRWHPTCKLTTSGVSLSGCGGKIPTSSAPGRGAHRASTGEFDGISQLHKHRARRGHNSHLWLLDLRRQRLGWLQQPPSRLQEARGLYTNSTQRLDEFIDNLDELLLPDSVRQIENMSVFDATSTRAAPELIGSNSNQSGDTTQSEFLSDLKEDLDHLLKIWDEGATACRGGHIFNN
jgi:hypothetical protein